MSRKRKKQKHQSKSKLPSQPQALRQGGLDAAEAQRFRDAIAHFKALGKAEPESDWRTLLQHAYLCRAGELEAKGMLKECLAIYQNRQQLSPQAAYHPAHIQLLLRLGHSAEAAKALNRAVKTLPASELAGLRARLAVELLAGNDELAGMLADDDPILSQNEVATRALQAYVCADSRRLEQALAEIPFRSPYRDFAIILKALVRAETDRSGAAAQLAHIDSASAFSTLAAAARLALLPETEFNAGLKLAGPNTRRFAASVRGWSLARLALWDKLQQPGASEPRSMFNVLQRQQQQLGSDWTRRWQLRLMQPDFPDSLRWLGGQWPAYEKALLNAWRSEQFGDEWDIVDSWIAVLDHLEAGGPVKPGSDQALRMALIQRRLVEKWRLLDDNAGNSYADAWEDDLGLTVLRGLEQSLELDPDYQPSYVLLIQHYHRTNQLKAARAVLESAQARWPGAIEVLLAALDVAVAGGAFKKAAGLARRILEIDPINRDARQRLVAAHLSHARKQAAKARDDLLIKELDAARDWANDPGLHRQIALVDGCAGLHTTNKQDRERAKEVLLGVVRELVDGINARLLIALEAGRQGRPFDQIVRKLGLKALKQIEKPDLLEFVRQLRAWVEQRTEPGANPDARVELDLHSYFSPVLERAAKLTLNQAEADIVCEGLARAGFNQSRRRFADVALKRWPGQPLFEYHSCAAELADRGFYWQSRRDMDNCLARLEPALRRAREEDDRGTVHRIEELLFKLDPGPNPGYMHGPDDDDAWDGTTPPAEFTALIEEFGIDGIIDILRQGELGSMIDAIEKNMGPKKSKEILGQLINQELPPEVMDGLIEEAQEGSQPKSKRKSANKTGNSSGNSKPLNPDQFELF